MSKNDVKYIAVPLEGGEIRLIGPNGDVVSIGLTPGLHEIETYFRLVPVDGGYELSKNCSEVSQSNHGMFVQKSARELRYATKANPDFTPVKPTALEMRMEKRFEILTDRADRSEQRRNVAERQFDAQSKKIRKELELKDERLRLQEEIKTREKEAAQAASLRQAQERQDAEKDALEPDLEGSEAE